MKTFLFILIVFCSCASVRPTQQPEYFSQRTLDSINNVVGVRTVDYGYWKEETVIRKEPLPSTPTSWPWVIVIVVSGVLMFVL